MTHSETEQNYQIIIMYAASGWFLYAANGSITCQFVPQAVYWPLHVVVIAQYDQLITACMEEL